MHFAVTAATAVLGLGFGPVPVPGPVTGPVPGHVPVPDYFPVLAVRGVRFPVVLAVVEVVGNA